VSIDIKHIRNNVELYEQNCLERNYGVQARYPAEIKRCVNEYHVCQRDSRELRERNNRVKLQLAKPTAVPRGDDDGASEEVAALRQMSKAELIAEATLLKERISVIERQETSIMREVEAMAAAIPNLTSDETPRGHDFRVVGYLNDPPAPDRVWRSHVDIGRDLDLLDFASAGTTSGWGWYYLLNEAAELEQALVQYALSVARKRGWGVVSPPSMVYSHIAAACGFQPRDQNGEQQVYSIQQSGGSSGSGSGSGSGSSNNGSDAGRKPELSLAGTAEIPLAGMRANTTMAESELPLRKVGVSRCYRAEAGARGVDTKGLYRVHEFTKVEMFAWTLPSATASTAVFDEMLSIQTEILTALGLHCRIIEMPSTDLGASATRKRDIEAFFPSRRAKDHGWGEVTSVSTCTDYQTRRLATKLDMRSVSGSGSGSGGGNKSSFPYTVNGTALAVPRVLAAILENGWDAGRGQVRIPACLWPWMGGREVIGG